MNTHQSILTTETPLVNNARWSLATRVLHLSMVITVSAQLALSLIMAPPNEENASILASTAFEAHEAFGVAALLIVLAHWLWMLIKQTDGGIANLFPWFGKAREEVINDVKALLKGQLPQGGVRGGLPGFIHGMGFLAVTGIAISGGLLFVLLPENGPFPGSVKFLAETHEFFGPLVWTYWGAHSAVALLHHRMGHTTLKDMFSFRKTS